MTYPTSSSLIGLGVDSHSASVLGTKSMPTTVLAGTTADTATQLPEGSGIVYLNTSSGGIRLPKISKGAVWVIHNASGNSATIYPASGDRFNTSAADATRTIANGSKTSYFGAVVGGVGTWAVL